MKKYVIGAAASVVGYAAAVIAGVPWYAAATGPVVWLFV